MTQMIWRLPKPNEISTLNEFVGCPTIEETPIYPVLVALRRGDTIDVAKARQEKAPPNGQIPLVEGLIVIDPIKDPLERESIMTCLNERHGEHQYHFIGCEDYSQGIPPHDYSSEIIATVRWYRDQKGYWPSVRDILDVMGVEEIEFYSHLLGLMQRALIQQRKVRRVGNYNVTELVVK